MRQMKRAAAAKADEAVTTAKNAIDQQITQVDTAKTNGVDLTMQPTVVKKDEAKQQ